MNTLSKISLFFIYIISIFGVIDIIKPTSNFFIFAIAVLTFGIQFYYEKRVLLVDLIIVLFALLSAMNFSVFVSDLFVKPIAVAMDCEGHKPVRTHYYDIIIVGTSIILIFGLIILKYHKQKFLADRLFSYVIVIVLFLCYFKVQFFRNLDNAISNVSTPTYVLPKGCE